MAPDRTLRLHRALLGYAALALALGGLGCGPSALEVPPSNDLYREAALEHADENYELAIRNYRYLLDHYPLDPRAEEVELRIAHAHLANGSHAEAIAAFSDFQRMHPTSQHLPEVEYRIAEAYVEQMDTVDRDLSAARNAHQRLQSVILRYPNSEFATLAREKLSGVREHLAAREFYVAQFYFAREEYQGGKSRAAAVLAQFPDTETAERTAEMLATAAEGAGDEELASLSRAAAEELAATRPEDEAAPKPPPGPAMNALRSRLAESSSLATVSHSRPPAL